MSGAPGFGKSTVARLLARSIGGVVIDHDVLRSSLIDSNISFDQAAKLAYRLQWTLAQDVMKQGLSVIVDSTCNFPEVLDQGSCKVRDVDLLDQRLRARDSMTSQRTAVDCPPPAAARGARDVEDSRALFKKWIEHPCRPEDNAVIVDSTGDLEVLRDSILKQILG
ncbi:MAG: hypothetical protein Q9163_004634 [Psora crenata]